MTVENIHISGCKVAVEVLRSPGIGDYSQPVRLSSVRLSGNNGTSGSALLMEPGTKVLLDSSLIEGNQANEGGSIVLAPTGSELIIQHSRFVGNKGSAVAFEGVKLQVRNVTFSYNTAPLGAAIKMRPSGEGQSESISRAHVSDSKFIGNKVSMGL